MVLMPSAAPRRAAAVPAGPSARARTPPPTVPPPPPPRRQPTAASAHWRTGCAALLAAALVQAAPQPSLAAVEAGKVITGDARVVDGDTLVVGRERIRLAGIDAPESAQTCTLPGGAEWACGKAAAAALRERVDAAGGRVRCTVGGGDRYSRSVARCSVVVGGVSALWGGGEEELNRWAVSRGWAWAYRAYSKDYVADEAAARQSKAGIWRSAKAQEPWEWRRERREAAAAARAAAKASAELR